MDVGGGITARINVNMKGGGETHKGRWWMEWKLNNQLDWKMTLENEIPTPKVLEREKKSWLNFLSVNS